MLFNPLKKFKKPDPNFITIVSGLPRSGTSLMMQILQAGGMEIITDMERQADDDNPRGYLEFERAKKLKEGDFSWLETCQGKAVKIISALLEFLPGVYQYKVIFMHRNMHEILASQKQMLIRRGEAPDKVDDDTMAELFRKHLKNVESWLAIQSNFDVISIQYEDILNQSRIQIENVGKFLAVPLDIEAMVQIPDKNLHHQRHLTGKE